MKFLCIILLFLLVSLCNGILKRPKRIVDSENVSYQDHRYMVFIVTQFQHKTSRQGCSGTIISDRVILTAAHCVHRGDDEAVQSVVLLGVPNINPISLEVQDIYTHPHYVNNPSTYMYDIAILILRDPIANLCKNDSSPKISPLYLDYSKGLKYDQCYGFGFGLTEISSDGDLSSVLRKVSIINLERRRTENEMCLLGYHEAEKGKLCAGDSGGPLICDTGNGLIQIGVNSQIFQLQERTKRESVDDIIAFCRASNTAVFTEIEATLDFIKAALQRNFLWLDFLKYQNIKC